MTVDGRVDDTSGESVIEHTFARMFEGWVDRQPDALAVIGDDGVRLTYAELERAANRIANAIDERDPEHAFPAVVLALGPTTDAIVAIVGAAKSGRAVTPIDVGDPPARLAEILGQLDPAVVLTEADGADLSLVPADRWLPLPLEGIPPDAPHDRRFRSVTADDVCLVIFTSGSTGVPKGVTRRLGEIAQVLRNKPAQHYAVRSAAVADHQWLAGYTSIRDPLCFGGTTVRYAARTRGPAGLAPFLAEHRVETLTAVPSLVRAMLDADLETRLPDLRTVHFAGDAVPRTLAVDLLDRLGPGAVAHVGYGSSEMAGVTSLDMHRDSVPDGDIVPVGRPLEGVEVEIVDPDAAGIGRVVVTTTRGTRGYVAGADPTHTITDLGDGRRRHETGDLGRLRPDGMLELHGRRAHMVKVRGQRVGVNEVEVAMRAIPGVADVAVGIHPDDADQRLTAWYVTDPGTELHVAALRQHLRPFLPAYMVPAAFVALPALPRNKSGKLDRFALPLPGSGRPDLGHPFEPPVGPVESAVAAAFGHVLGVEPVGRNDDFSDLGGDSLGAAEVMTLIAAALGRDLPLSVFVEASTPAELARRFDEPHAEAADRFVVLQPDGDGAPLYCLHGGGGQVLSYATLAERLGPAQPFVGVQMRSRDRARRLFRVRTLARRYADLIAERQQGHPCVVAGHSYGGLLAHEVARQLAERGEAVERCIVLDAGLRRKGAPVLTGSDRSLLRIKDLLYAVHALVGLRPRPHSVTTERMVAARWGIALHRPRPSGVPLLVVRATDLPGDRGMARWAELTDAECAVIELPGDHHSVLAAPHVDQLAAEIAAQLG